MILARTVFASVLGSCFTVAARADIVVGDTLGSNPAHRYRESDALFLGTASSFFFETNSGMALGPDGNIYIAAFDIGGGAILRFDASNGTRLGALVPYGDHGYSAPHGLVFANGSVYSISNWYGGNSVLGVMRWNATSGAFGGVVVPPGADGLTALSELSAMPNGDVLVGDGNRLNRYDKDTMAFISTFIASGAGSAGTFGPDGNLYTSQSSTIRRFDGTTGAYLGDFITGVSPADMTFGMDGNLYVTTGLVVRRYHGSTGALLGTFVSDPAHLPQATQLLTVPPVPEATAPAVLLVVLGATVGRRRVSSGGRSC